MREVCFVYSNGLDYGDDSTAYYEWKDLPFLKNNDAQNVCIFAFLFIYIFYMLVLELRREFQGVPRGSPAK